MQFTYIKLAKTFLFQNLLTPAYQEIYTEINAKEVSA